MECELVCEVVDSGFLGKVVEGGSPGGGVKGRIFREVV